MDVRRAALLALCLAALAVTLGFALPARAAGGGGGTPNPLPVDQATAAANAIPALADGSSTSPVDGQTALDAGNQAGADTSIESGISAQAAVGLAQLVEGNVLSLTRPACWATSLWHQWGTWPYEQKITDTTYWCAVYNNHITYRTSSTTASGTLCDVSWRANQLIGGGVGRAFTFITNRASAGFSCETVVPWITIHTSHHIDVKHNDRGATTLVGSG
jgi:hypothetical protein